MSTERLDLSDDAKAIVAAVDRLTETVDRLVEVMSEPETGYVFGYDAFGHVVSVTPTEAPGA